jgi:hypothetical protein
MGSPPVNAIGLQVQWMHGSGELRPRQEQKKIHTMVWIFTG